MSTGLSVYDGMSDPLVAIKHLGRSIAISGMFGCGSPEQGEVLALECMARRTPPLALAERYHFIKGKLAMKADAMLAEFHRLGGKVKQLERSPLAASVELSIGGQTNTYSLSWTEAAAEPFVYEGKESDVVKLLAAKNGKKPELKAKYATPRARMQMLWARVVSDGVRAICPQVNQGRYTPEELDGDGDEGDATDVVDAVAAAETVVDKPTERAPEKPAEQPADGPCSATDAALVNRLFVEVGLTPEQRTAVLAKRGASAVRNLTVPQAAELIANLQAKLKTTSKGSHGAERPAEQPADGSGTSEPSDGPATPLQVEEVKRLLGEIEQVHPGTLAKLTTKLNEAGYKKLVELPRTEAERLLIALQVKSMAAFFEASLRPKETAATNPPKN